MLIEALAPLRVRVNGEIVSLASGQTIDLPHEKAERLLRQAGDRVRVVASPPIYWERPSTGIMGPATVEFLVKVGDSVWVAAQFEGHAIWINATMLRSRQQFESQCPWKTVELVRSPR